MRRLALAALVLLLPVAASLFSACGGAPPSPKDVTVSASTATSTIAPGGTALLNGTVQGFSGDMLSVWSVKESFDESGTLCNFDYPDTSASFATCKYGYVKYHKDQNMPTQAVYYAPLTPGTYHVNWLVIINSSDYADMFTKGATVEIVVK